jgi:hypothetical protein
MTFENKQKITEIDLGWQAADYVSPVVSVENDDKDVDPSKLQFAWFKVESSIQPSDDEEKERIRAMQIQYENKIINKYGMPYGMSMPKEFKDVISENEKAKKGSKWDRKRQRLIDRQIEKDMQVERNKAKREQEEIDKLKSTSVNTSTNNITSNIKLTSVLSKLTDT